MDFPFHLRSNPRASPEKTNFNCVFHSRYFAIILHINVHMYIYRVWILLTTGGIVLCTFLYTSLHNIPWRVFYIHTSIFFLVTACTIIDLVFYLQIFRFPLIFTVVYRATLNVSHTFIQMYFCRIDT